MKNSSENNMHFSSQYIFTSFPKSSLKTKLKYKEPIAESQMEKGTVSKKVSVPLRQLLNVMVKAANENVAWVQDFKEEQITISSDLHEVMQVANELQLRAEHQSVN